MTNPVYFAMADSVCPWQGSQCIEFHWVKVIKIIHEHIIRILLESFYGGRSEIHWGQYKLYSLFFCWLQVLLSSAV